MLNYHGFVRVAAAVPKLRVADCDYNAGRILGLLGQAQQENVEVVSNIIAAWNDYRSEPQELKLEQIGESYARYRLHVPEAERVMMRSLESYGQISPVVVCIQEGRTELHCHLYRGQRRLLHQRSEVRAGR